MLTENCQGKTVLRRPGVIEIAHALSYSAWAGVVALRNPHHIGRLGTYGEMCANADLVSLHFVNVTDARPAVAPWRASAPIPSASPYRAPSPNGRSFSTWRRASLRWGRSCVAPNKGEQLKPGILLDGTGKPSGRQLYLHIAREVGPMQTTTLRSRIDRDF
jgi:L-lactate dehydrogenase